MWHGYWKPDTIKNRKVNMKVEYESPPIRHLAVQCPDCGNWFFGHDIFKYDCQYDYQLRGAECHCPKCGSDFKVDFESNIEKA